MFKKKNLFISEPPNAIVGKYMCRVYLMLSSMKLARFVSGELSFCPTFTSKTGSGHVEPEMVQDPRRPVFRMECK